MPDDEIEFAAALSRAGLSVPEERRAAMLEAYRSMQALLKVLETPLAYADEPAVMPRLHPGRPQ